jgi:hypothetical protein
MVIFFSYLNVVVILTSVHTVVELHWGNLKVTAPTTGAGKINRLNAVQ